ncbi:hypothetical protein FA95DRAFT_1553934 [Auriscalpium vulgare]|uniref:Uncharacterized protein n=1 Tax=Auriscalpium vulgare TaxID=40419 RepID=A0ACB8S648_9AGAM|nr:hypothetical protein FA95DRAFT_1553934 [Auriscalpium vulgare]
MIDACFAATCPPCSDQLPDCHVHDFDPRDSMKNGARASLGDNRICAARPAGVVKLRRGAGEVLCDTQESRQQLDYDATHVANLRSSTPADSIAPAADIDAAPYRLSHKLLPSFIVIASAFAPLLDVVVFQAARPTRCALAFIIRPIACLTHRSCVTSDDDDYRMNAAAGHRSGLSARRV